MPAFVFAVEDSANLNLDVVGQPTPTTSAVTGGGGLALFYIRDLAILNIGADSAEIYWRTSKNSICNFYWGQTVEYKKEIISETQNLAQHSTKLTALQPSTVYHFKIICITSGQKDQTQDQQFKTLPALNNVSNFTAKASGNNIILRWQNPADFYQIKIVRSENFFPVNPSEGAVIYEGFGNFFTDENAKAGKIYYYTIFTLDRNGNYSSGAVMFSAVVPVGQAPVPTPVIEPIIGQIQKITINDFDFYLNGLPVKQGKETVKVEPGQTVSISIPCQKINEYQNVFFTIDSKEKFSYLLSPDKNGACGASFTAPDQPGKYSVLINFFDASHKMIFQLKSELNVFKIAREFDWRPIVILWTEILVMALLLWWIINKNIRKLKPKKAR